MARAFSKIAFTDNVLARQEANGSADMYARFLTPEADAADMLGPVEAEFIANRDGFYQATVSDTGWPYVQFRGGPAGFLKVLDNKTLGYADYRGNRQYISSGNLSGNDRVSLILMDYPNRRRLKVWARARQVERDEDQALVNRLMMPGYRALPERAIVLSIEALDWNCPAHIPQRFTADELAPQFSAYEARIRELEAEIARLKKHPTGSA